MFVSEAISDMATIPILEIAPAAIYLERWLSDVSIFIDFASAVSITTAALA
jgi:hypothetical protein